MFSATIKRGRPTAKLVPVMGTVVTMGKVIIPTEVLTVEGIVPTEVVIILIKEAQGGLLIHIIGVSDLVLLAFISPAWIF